MKTCPDLLPLRADLALPSSGKCRFQALIEQTMDAIALLSPEGAVLYANRAAGAILGYEPEEVVGEYAFDDLHPDDLPMMRSAFARLLEQPGGSVSEQYRYLHRSGDWKWMEGRITNLLHEPEVQALVVNYRDITHRKELYLALAESEERYRLLAEHATDMIARLRPDGVFLYASPASRQLLGYEPDELVGTSNTELLHPDDLEELYRTAPEADAIPESFVSTYRIRHKDGGYVWLETTCRTVRSARTGEVVEFVTVSRDITERKHLEEELVQQAFYDPVTYLPNRALFVDRLEQSLAPTAEGGHRPLAVLFLDLDRFKLVNDVFGHAAGDELLREVSRRLRRTLRPSDMVSRFGGDEFTILLENINGPRDAAEVAARLIEQLRAPLEVGGRETFVSASVGIALSRGEACSADDLLRNADVALYRAKATGKNRYVLFDEPMSAAVAERLHLESDLHQALERGELQLHYQPEVDLRSGRIVGLEALLRWLHPDRGLLLPDEFLSIAEETGLITAIGGWVREEACRQAAEWNALRAGESPLMVSVNLSAWEFQQPRLVSEVLRAVHRSGLPSPNLRLELSESVLIHDLDRTVSILMKLRESGLRVAIDDFGAGYSSLGYLRRLPVDVLKIDRSFVQELSHDDKSRHILRAITELAAALEIDVTAEGIESPRQRDELLEARCLRGQGYLYARPLPAEGVTEILRAA